MQHLIDSDVDYTIQYSSFHQDSPEHRTSQIEIAKTQLSKNLPASLNSSVLDIGCGWGFALSALLELGYADVQGIDIDEGQVEVCRKYGLRASQASDAVTFLDRCGETFDVVLLIDVLEHVPKEKQVPLLRAIYHRLRVGGRLIVSVPNASHPLASHWFHNDFTHCCSYTERSLRFVLRNGWFERISLEPPPPAKRPSLRLWSADVRNALWSATFMYLWRKFLVRELSWERLENVQLGLNIVCVAYKEPTK